MLAQAATLGCTTADAACLCNKSDFAYGIRDCANEACGSDAPKIIAYGTTFCKGEFFNFPMSHLAHCTNDSSRQQRRLWQCFLRLWRGLWLGHRNCHLFPILHRRC